MSNSLSRLLDIMARLRAPDGCPWDREQTFQSIVRYTIEEVYEVAETIETNDVEALKDELGDLLFQVVFYSQLAVEQDLFDFDAIARAAGDKMVKRHPHVFGTSEVANAEAQTAAWEATKAAERDRRSGAGTAGVLDGVTVTLPALMRAVKLQARAARVGFDWPEAEQVLAKIDEEKDEVRAEMTHPTSPDGLRDEVGDLLFACVNLARKLNIDPEGALRGANRKFERRFRKIEERLAAEGRGPSDASLEEMEALWVEAKHQE